MYSFMSNAHSNGNNKNIFTLSSAQLCCVPSYCMIKYIKITNKYCLVVSTVQSVC